MTHQAAKWTPEPRRRRRRGPRLHLWLAIAAILGVLLGVCGMFLGPRVALGSSDQLAPILEAELRGGGAPPGVTRFYEARGFAPLWVTERRVSPFGASARLSPEGRHLVEWVASATDERGRLAALVSAADTGEPQALAEAEIALSTALTRFVQRRGGAIPEARLEFIDPELARTDDARAVLDHAALAPSLGGYLFGLREVNPVYRALQAGLRTYRSDWSALPQTPVDAGPALRFGAVGGRVAQVRRRMGLAGDRFDEALETQLRRFQAAHGLPRSGEADPVTVAALNRGAGFYEALILANIERARALPLWTGERFVLVNIPAAELTLYSGSEPISTMRAVVGAQASPTPPMAGLIRRVVYNPYWNIPVDLVRDVVAPRMIRGGERLFRAEGFEALSDWTDQATPLAPSQIDWNAVADGRQELRVRERPGPRNMMGRMKFMLPNELGIYLHDTPERDAFQIDRRLMSAGCIRVEHAPELAEWLLNARAEAPTAEPEQPVDLTGPVPVYILYLTAAPGRDGVVFHPDVYRRDAALLAALASAE